MSISLLTKPSAQDTDYYDLYCNSLVSKGAIIANSVQVQDLTVNQNLSVNGSIIALNADLQNINNLGGSITNVDNLYVNNISGAFGNTITVNANIDLLGGGLDVEHLDLLSLNADTATFGSIDSNIVNTITGSFDQIFPTKISYDVDGTSTIEFGDMLWGNNAANTQTFMTTKQLPATLKVHPVLYFNGAGGGDLELSCVDRNNNPNNGVRCWNHVKTNAIQPLTTNTLNLNDFPSGVVANGGLTTSGALSAGSFNYPVVSGTFSLVFAGFNGLSVDFTYYKYGREVRLISDGASSGVIVGGPLANLVSSTGVPAAIRPSTFYGNSNPKVGIIFTIANAFTGIGYMLIDSSTGIMTIQPDVNFVNQYTNGSSNAFATNLLVSYLTD